MPTIEGPKVSLSFDTVLLVLAVILAAIGVLVAIVKGWEAWKKISVRDRVTKLEGRMAKVEARLQLGDKRFQLQSDDMGQTLNTLQALLIHFISGNDHDRLREQLTDLGDYMTQRATRATEYAAEHEQQQNGGSEG